MNMDWLLSPWAIGGAFAGLTATAIAAWFFAPWVIMFFTQTKIGRSIAAVGAVVFALWLVAVRIFSAGRAKEREIIEQNNERVERHTEQRQNDLQKADPDDLRRRANRWVRD